jgi:hypothetical protein
MKKSISFVVLSFCLVTLSNAQSGLLGGAKSALGGGLSSDDIVNGLKQALSQGTQKSTDKLSAADGFFKDAAVKILFPPEAQKVEKTLRSAIAAFRPVIESSLQKTGATQAWKNVFDIYNKNPFAKKVNTDLPGYVTLKALDGIFFYVAQEEKNIRSNPAAQATDLLKKVFGGK